METEKRATIDRAGQTGASVGVAPTARDDARTSDDRGDRRVLVVGAEPPTQLLEAMLRMAGADDVRTVVDGQRAVDCCLQIGPELVVVDLDIGHDHQLTGLTVLAGLRHVLAQERFLPLVALTSDASAQARMLALAAGANDYFTKPLEELDFVERLRNLLRMRGLYLQVQRRNRDVRETPDPIG